MTLGVDVGGTFTDFAHWNGRELRVGKRPTTIDQSEGVVEGAREVASGRDPGGLRHGTTVATNALLERRGARTALLATAGFEDVIEIGRQDRPSLYDPFVDRPDPLVASELRFGVARTEPAATTVPEVSDGIAELTDRVAAAEPEAIAISLLYGYLSPDLERRIAGALTERLPDVPVSASSDVAPEFREYERTSTTVLNAYLGPVTGRYLDRLASRTRSSGLDDGIQVMRSSGGLIDLTTAARLPAAVLLSGPAGGVVATAAMSKSAGLESVVAFDMGGTSTDVCRIDGGRWEVSFERAVDGYPCRMPAVAVHTVGAGGGSVGWVDPGGALRVGPRSAGATPGPACYARGGREATVTDANLHLGLIGPDARLAGRLPVRADLAAGALDRLGGPLELGASETANGIVEIVETHMERAIRAVSVEEGADPRGAWLVAFGGAGGLHAVQLARRLEMAGAIVPLHAGVFSALGLLLAPPRHDAGRSLAPGEDLDAALSEVRRAAADGYARQGAGALRGLRSMVDVRYLGQAHEVTVEYEPGWGEARLEEAFHAAHAVRNGFARPGDSIEVVTVRAVASGEPVLRWSDLPPMRPYGEARAGTRPVGVGGEIVEADVWLRAGLVPGSTVTGPAVVEEPEATTWIPPGHRAEVWESGALAVPA